MENRYWRWTSWFAIFIILLLIGYSAGFSKGLIKGSEWTIRLGMDFIDIDFDEEKMIELLRIYQRYCGVHHLGECLDKWDIGGR